VAAIVGEAPSTFHMILPEVYLETPREAPRVESAHRAMRDYLAQGLLEPHQGMVYVERTALGRTRRGLVLCLDLECYDYNNGSQTLIRATEGTVVERLPPRIRIRESAPLELPHILVLIDDPARTVIEPVAARCEELPKLYDFELMLGSGHLRGFSAHDAELEASVIGALTVLANPETFRQRHGVGADKGVLLFAMGDGNHSLATAKAIWEQRKATVGPNHPSRYALVEIENVHDEGLVFEPIHRVLFGLKQDLSDRLRARFGDSVSIEAVRHDELVRRVEQHQGPAQVVGMVSPGGSFLVTLREPTSALAVGTLQSFLDEELSKGSFEKIDYVHGADVVGRLGAQPGNVGLFLPGMDKSDLFRTVVLDGALPRKTFSMGEAREKRFYMECRRLS
jgi:hypothetical protein